MPIYFARVELHEADEDDYEMLRDFLKVEGFSHCHEVKGKSKKLPTGFYKATLSEESVTKVAALVKERADATFCENEITVVKSAGTKSYLSESCP